LHSHAVEHLCFEWREVCDYPLCAHKRFNSYRSDACLPGHHQYSVCKYAGDSSSADSCRRSRLKKGVTKKKFTLEPRVEIPVIGFGTWQLKAEEARQSVETALELGYRHLDTADVYQNHQEVGKAIQSSGIPRSELFLTTKVWRTEFHHDNVLASVARFQEELQTEYFDLMLMHWPNKEIPVEETLEALQELKEAGTVRSIGVSNFTIKHLEQALQTGVKISTNQVEFHPSLNQKELKTFCDQHKILITAYSPIAQGKDLSIEIIQQLSAKYDRSPAQIILNWLISKNIVVIPRSTKPERIKDGFGSADWTMQPADIALIEALDLHSRLVQPDFNEFEL